ncbi:MAG: hypothetical protein A2521_03925 [Deltaproteobacteria bacterium RIFOXYD12_FULL_57_12]|nr:MAG: hypothetical protein A2521_03925 [Deltaproteobacteria bacterium RIFOXYD12_FULL_57_12]
MIKKILISLTGLAALAVLCAAGAFYWFVVIHPGDEIRQENIEKILSMESPVYYRDGQTKIGVFFQEAHRQYLTYDQIPENFVKALVAAEDDTFFSHPGVDVSGILRALFNNIKAGRVVQGGSTITQQTAKNLFKRKNRSLQAKLKELLIALRLERHYSKEKILEFYANQFYVSGNGHGLGVASRYFFNKPAADLDLLECAFIAGSVKRPNFYNPFIQKDKESTALAKDRAHERARYVLAQMFKLGMIDQAQYQNESGRDILFHKGKTFYRLNTVMDLVKEALNTPLIEEALAQHGIDNIATSGIRIIASVDKNLQDTTLYALRKELSRLDIRLSGYDPQKYRKAVAEMQDEEIQEIQTGTFLFGKIAQIDTGPSPVVHVEFQRASKTFGTGRIDAAGLMPFVAALVKWQGQRWTEPKASDLAEFANRLRPGDIVYASVRNHDPATGETLLDLEKYPKIQGAALTLKDGMIRAMAGGTENYFYNRAIAARRSMGSVIKPLVYAAALQLGWNSTDLLNNERNIFVYQNLAYFPRPDHQTPHKRVSMSWAGVHSENVATVWLLYHLCDRLSPADFKLLTDYLGLNRKTNETYEQYVRRLRDEMGILVDQNALLQAAFKEAVAALEPDLIFEGKQDELEYIRNLHYGAGFALFAQETEKLREPGYDQISNRKLLVEREIQVRNDVLSRNYLRLRQLLNEARQQLQGESQADAPFGGRLYQNPDADRYLYTTSPPGTPEWTAVNFAELGARYLQMSPPEKTRFWDSLFLEGVVSASSLDLLHDALNKSYQQLAARLPYSPEVLYNLSDFRVLAGLRYMVGLSQHLGIRSKLDPVLSFPLGSNVISLYEAARAYEGLITGWITTSTGEGASEPLAIIERIEDSDGELIYAPELVRKRVFAPQTSLAISHILRNVVKFGTGRFAEENIGLPGQESAGADQPGLPALKVPVFGKTGTANQFSNAAFVGFVPEALENSNVLSLENGYTVAAYVGYDNNLPMEYKSTHISGSSGALPVWTRMANGILQNRTFTDRLDTIDILFRSGAKSGTSPTTISYPDLGQVEVPVDKNSGIMQPLATAEQGGRKNFSDSEPTILTFGKVTQGGELEPARFFQPYWAVSGNDR